ncbi:MAG: response regulator [SAR324 cluster bacterium]|nr:response regulator [SAR324 cluster bacterium]
MAAERRKYLRVLFEETIQVETEEWTDPMATGLDISLNGTRFHCEHSLSEGSEVSVVFKPGLKIQGVCRWCWPIEWYYQAAVEFPDMHEEEQTLLRDYISETSGEPYPDYSDEEPEEAVETDEMDEMDDLSLEEEDDAFADDLLIEEDDDSLDSDSYQGALTPLVFAGKRVVIVDNDDNRIETIEEYLTKRNQFSIEKTGKLSHLWPLLKAKPADLILLTWGLNGEDSVDMLQNIQGRFPDLPIILFSGPVSLEERLEGLNGGAVDFITRPATLSSISQSILQAFSAMASASSLRGLEYDENDGLENEDDLNLNDDLLEDDFEL